MALGLGCCLWGAPSSPPMPSGGAVQPRGSLGDSFFFSTTPQQPPPPPLSFTTAVNTVSALQLDSLHYVHVLVPQSRAGKPRNECSTTDAIFLVFLKKKKKKHESPINTSDCRSCACPREAHTHNCPHLCQPAAFQPGPAQWCPTRTGKGQAASTGSAAPARSCCAGTWWRFFKACP